MGDLGFIFNCRGDYYTLEAGEANALAPGKRPRSTLQGTLVMKDGQPLLVMGTPGADNQVLATMQTLLNMIDFGMNVQQAVEMPTLMSTSFHESVYPHPIAGTLILPKVLADQTGAALGALGHHVLATRLQKPYGQQISGAGAVKMVRIDPRTGVFAGGVSPAKDDYAMGW